MYSGFISPCKEDLSVDSRQLQSLMCQFIDIIPTVEHDGRLKWNFNTLVLHALRFMLYGFRCTTNTTVKP